MLLKEKMENLQNENVNVKVGGKSQFYYCGEINGKAYEVLAPYLDRKVTRTYPSIVEPNTMIVKFRGQKNDKRGKYIATDEYNRKNHITTNE